MLSLKDGPTVLSAALNCQVHLVLLLNPLVAVRSWVVPSAARIFENLLHQFVPSLITVASIEAMWKKEAARKSLFHVKAWRTVPPTVMAPVVPS